MRIDHVGGCHCGAIGFTFSTEKPPSSWSIRACQCRFCLGHAALSLSDPTGSLRFHHRDPERLVRYRFGLRTAEFLLCRECGVYIGAVTNDGEHGIVNTNTFAERIALPPPQPMTYEGETEVDRLARRSTRWTPIAA